MMTSSFVSRRIQVNFALAGGTFGSDPQHRNTKGVSGLRVNCEIKKMGTPAKNEAKLRIYGMSATDMNQLSTLGINPLAVRKNLIQVLAGDSDGLTTAFQGEITGAWVNYRTPPDLYFEVHAIAGFYPSIAPIHPTSLPGGVRAANIFQNLAQQMGAVFQNNGVTAVIQNPYLFGTAFDQARTLAQTLGIEFGLDDNVLYIAPKGQVRVPKGMVPVVSPSTGMKEYPIWDKQGLVVECLFDPLLQLGGSVVIAGSMVEKANGTWRIHGLDQNIAAHDPHQSPWISKLHLAKVGT